MPISLAQTPVASATGSFLLGSPITAGNCLVLVNSATFATESWTVADPSNGTWGSALLYYTHFGAIQFSAFPSCVGGTYTVIATETTGGKTQWGVLFEVVGLATTLGALLDQSATTFQGSGSSSFSIGPTGTTTNANELVIAAFQGNASTTWTVGGGYTLVTPATQNLACEYAIVTSTGTQTATATASGTPAADKAIITLNSAAVFSPLTSSFTAVLP